MTEQEFTQLLQQNGENAIMPAFQKIAEIVVEVYTQGCKDGVSLQQRVAEEGVDEWRKEAVSTMLNEVINKLRGNGTES